MHDLAPLGGPLRARDGEGDGGEEAEAEDGEDDWDEEEADFESDEY